MAREQAQELIRSGEMVLPPDHAEQAAKQVERLRLGQRRITTLKRWRSANKTCYEHVLMFGDILLANEEGWYSIFERPTGKLLWGTHYYAGDIHDMYRLALHLSLVTDWKRVAALPAPEYLGICWRIAELTWETGHSTPWEWFARMRYDLMRAAQAARASSCSAL